MKWSRSMITDIAQAIARIAYGLFTFAICLLLTARRRGEPFKRSAAKSQLEASVSRQLWSLEDDNENLLTHDFITTDKGIRLHYLSPRQRIASLTNLIIFLHGFPDSSYLWRQVLLSSDYPDAKLVALDLPGFGGSDDIGSYGANEVLNTMAEAIILLRRRYLGDSDDRAQRCILVGHDWGGLISFRLAAETKGLLDHIIVMNSFYPPHMLVNGQIRIARFDRYFQQWLPNLVLLDHFNLAFEAIRPLIVQLWKLNYTFMFRLPVPLAKYFPTMADALIRTCHVLSHRSIPNRSDLSMATSWATSCGPTPLEAQSCSLETGAKYGKTVLARSQTKPPGDWDQRIRLYKERLATDPWTPSLCTARYVTIRNEKTTNQLYQPLDFHSRTNYISRVKESRKFKCPVQIIFGMKDEALDPRMCLDGIEKFFVAPQKINSGENVIRLSEVGHWSPVSKEGIAALDTLLRRCFIRA